MASKLQDLINRLCPNGVEYRRLGEIATIERGNGLQKSDFKASGIPCIHYGQLYTKLNTVADSALTFVDEKTAANLKSLNHGDLLMAVTSENVEDVCKCIAWLGNDGVVVGGHTAIIRHAQNAKFLSYWFQTQDFFAQKKKLAHGTKVIEVTPQRLTDIVIPVPPLEVQSEIVQILDNFAELTAELTAELEKRKKQYEHYRRALLCGVESSELRVESSGWPMVKLGDVCEMKAGKAIAAVKISAELDEQHPVACYGANGFRGYVAEPNQDGDHCIIGRQGALCGNVCFASGRFYATEHAVVVTQLGKYDDRYLYHMLTEMDLNQYKSQGAQPGLSIGKLEELSIPLPPLAEQRRIVSILDRFDRLCNDLTSGLPAEIAARKKQYAYYRDKLLELRVGS